MDPRPHHARIPITAAFQPIVDVASRRIDSYEALVRGKGGEPASAVFDGVSGQALIELDDQCRRVAVTWAAALGMDCRLNLNCLPQTIMRSPETLHSLLDHAERLGLDRSQIVFEITEREAVEDAVGLATVINDFRRQGVGIALDDFGAGHSGLNLLADMQPDKLKLDMNLIRSIESHGPRQAIVRGIVSVCTDLAIDVVAEGVETSSERSWCESEGIELFQGYLFARPAVESLHDGVIAGMGLVEAG